MSLDDLGNIGEFLGALGVIASLVYLAIQIRQNTSSVRASTFHGAASRAADLTRAIAEQRELAHIYGTGMAGIDQLEDDNEVLRFLMFLSTMFRQFEDLFFQYRAGTISAEAWEAWRYSLRMQIVNPGFSPFWQLRRLAFTESFRQFVDAELETAEPLPTLTEMYETLNRAT